MSSLRAGTQYTVIEFWQLRGESRLPLILVLRLLVLLQMSEGGSRSTDNFGLQLQVCMQSEIVFLGQCSRTKLKKMASRVLRRCNLGGVMLIMVSFQLSFLHTRKLLLLDGLKTN